MSNSVEQKELSPLYHANGNAYPVVGSPDEFAISITPNSSKDLVENSDYLTEEREQGERVEVVVRDSCANAKGLREEDALLENGSQSIDSDDISTDPTRGHDSLKETSFSIGLQVVFPFLLAGFGTVAAGMVLDIVQISEILIILVKRILNDLLSDTVIEESYLGFVFTCSEMPLILYQVAVH
eukprot:g38210.t1